jgi:ribonuclease HI
LIKFHDFINSSMSRFYAVARGRHPGIYLDWPTAQEQVSRFPGAQYHAFSTLSEAQAYLNSILNLPRLEPPPVSSPQAEIIYTDGSCVQAQGGYAAINLASRQIVYGPVPLAPCTNQKAELYAILRALEVFPHLQVVRTDSQYAINSLTQWIHQWRQNGWRTARGQPVENRTLIETIANRLAQHPNLRFEHVRGHHGEEYNEMADVYANQGRLRSSEAQISF